MVRTGCRCAAVGFRCCAIGRGVPDSHRSLEHRQRLWGRRRMKAEVAQQRCLLEIAELDAELAKMDHRVSRLPERAEIDRIQAEQVAAADRVGALQIALEDLNTQVSRF